MFFGAGDQEGLELDLMARFRISRIGDQLSG